MKFQLSFGMVLGLCMLLLIYPKKGRSQESLDLDAQLERMKGHYEEWVSSKPDTRLFVEYDPSPIAIDIVEPRFSWILNLEGQNRKQSGYQILVASSEKILDNDIGDVWDTGLILSEQSVQVRYKGKPLESNTAYFWKVRIRDESGILHPYSEAKSFSTGLFDQNDWAAKWIGRGDPCEIIPDPSSFVMGTATEELKNAYREARSPLFRNEFSVNKKIARARVFIAGLGLYELRLNGKKVGRHMLTPARTDFRKRVLYDTYDVTSEIILGNNALGITLGNGWFNGQKKYWGWQMQWYGSPRVILQLEVEFQDGGKQTIVSDQNWKSSWGPIVFNCLYDGEHYDARMEQDNWDMFGFDDKTWTQANVVPSPGGKLQSALHEPGRITQTIHPTSLSEPRKDTFVFDLGQNFAGWVKMQVNGPTGTKVKLKFAEQIHTDGMIDPSSSRAAIQEDQYILKGEGVEIFEPRFTYHGFQYVQVTGYPGKPKIDDLTGCFVQNAVSPGGSFLCSNDLINRIHFCTVQSQRSNIQMGVPTDDTQRPERQGWGGDALMTAQEAMLNTSIQRVYSKWFADFHDQQDEIGRLGFITPRPGIKEDLVWSSAFVVMPWYQYVHYADTTVLEGNYDAILRYMNYLSSQGRSDVEIKQEGRNPLFKDYVLDPNHIGFLQQAQWGDHLSLADEYKSWSGLPLSISTAIYYNDLQTVMSMAKVLGKEDHFERLKHTASKVKEAFNEKFLNLENGYYDDQSQAAQTWPLFFEMVPEEYQESVLKTLIKDIVEIRDGHPSTGYVGTKFMIDLLDKNDRQDIIWDMTQKTDFPSWGYSLRNGKTTITEKWADGGSQNHVVLGAAIDPWFFTSLAGIKSKKDVPGFKEFIIEPYIPEDGLDWVEASVHTLYGTISSSWKKKSRKIEFVFTIPPNTSAKIILPGGVQKKKIMEIGSGTYSYTVTDY